MGSGVSAIEARNPQFLQESVQDFYKWYNHSNSDDDYKNRNKQDPKDRQVKTDLELYGYFENFLNSNSLCIEDLNRERKEDHMNITIETRSPVHTIVTTCSTTSCSMQISKPFGNSNIHKEYHTEIFMDSVFVMDWLNTRELRMSLFDELAIIGLKNKPTNISTASKEKTKYPLWTKYYGLPRSIDGSYPLDRWGSYHEGWIRVEDPPNCIKLLRQKLINDLNLPEESVNSIVVNYYFDGETTYIPAHRDTTACLQDGSHVICLSLGATRSFALCDNKYSGQYERTKYETVKEWTVFSGDLFCIGPETNDAYCHVVPKDENVSTMRISLIFRSVTKSFLNKNAVVKSIVYANGERKTFSAECITTNDYLDPGSPDCVEHIADLIEVRERRKEVDKKKEKEKKEALLDKGEGKGEGGEIEKSLTSYYLGQGVAVPLGTDDTS